MWLMTKHGFYSIVEKVPGQFHVRSVLRGVAGRFLVRYADMTQRDVAAKLAAGSGGAISRQMRKVNEMLASDKHLRRQVARAEEQAEKLRQSMRKAVRIH